jgi:hypothetical protein
MEMNQKNSKYIAGHDRWLVVIYAEFTFHGILILVLKSSQEP